MLPGPTYGQAGRFRGGASIDSKLHGWSPLLHTQARGHASLAFAMIEAVAAGAVVRRRAVLLGRVEPSKDA